VQINPEISGSTVHHAQLESLDIPMLFLMGNQIKNITKKPSPHVTGSGSRLCGNPIINPEVNTDIRKIPTFFMAFFLLL
jgi:hypothetical protein